MRAKDNEGRGNRNMNEELLIQALKEEMHGLRTEITSLREVVTELRVSMSDLARTHDLLALDKRVIEVEHNVSQIKDDAISRRDFRRWLVPIIVSVVCTLMVLGLKLWDILFLVK